MNEASSHTIINRSCSRYGSGRSSTASMTLKMEVFAPMPSASVSTATVVKPGFFSSWRKANFKSFISQRLHWIDVRRATAGSLRQRRRDSPDPTKPVVRAVGLLVARVDQRNCIEAGLLKRLCSRRAIAAKIVTACNTDCSGSDDWEAKTTSRSEMGFLRPANGTRIGPPEAGVKSRSEAD